MKLIAVLRCVAVSALVTPVLAQTNPPDAASRENLRLIVAGVKAYGLLYDGKKPEKMSTLLDEGLVENPATFVNPATGHSLPARSEVDEKTDYTFEPLAAAPDLIVREKLPTVSPGKVLAIFEDGTVKLIDAPELPTATTTSPAVTHASSLPPVAGQPRAEEQRLSPPPDSPRQSEPTPPTVAPPPPTRIGPSSPTAASPFGAAPQPVTRDYIPGVTGPPEDISPVAPAPSDITGWLNSANSALLQGNLSEAKRLYAVALQHAPESVDAIIGMGRCRNASGELDAALAEYQKLMRVAPATPNLRSWMAELLVARRQYEEARALLYEELRGTNAPAWALSWLGTVEMESGNTPTGTSLLQQAAALDPNIVEARYRNGDWLEHMNQPARALLDLNAVTVMNPNFAGAYYALGSCYAKTGHRDLAIRHYELFLARDSNSEWSRRARAELTRLKAMPATPAR